MATSKTSDTARATTRTAKADTTIEPTPADIEDAPTHDGQTDAATTASTRDTMSADELRVEAEGRDLPTSGTKADLTARLRAADAKEQRAKDIKSNPLLADDATINADATLDYATKVRVTAEELAQRLTDEVHKPLSDMQQMVDDPRSGALLASSRRVIMQVEQAQMALRGLVAAAAAMGQDATL